MSKEAFSKIAAGLSDAIAYASGTADLAQYAITIPTEVDVKAIRRRQNLSQEEFARRYGFSLGRVRDWEQGRSDIDAPSRILLTVIDKEPEAVVRALAAA
jgi:putative transcriptional regulator